jgi:uncharacterized protein involved in exopolysaccharide biosynthesis
MRIELTTRSLLSAFFRRINLFLIVICLFLLAGLGYLYKSKTMYESQGSILVRFGHDATPNVNAPNSSNPTELSQNDRREIIQSYAEILQSHDLLKALVREFGAETLYPGITRQSAGVDIPDEAAVKRLQMKDMTIRTSLQSTVIEVHVMNQDPKLAAKFTRRLFDVFIARQSEMYNNPQTEFLDQQVLVARDRLARSQQELHDFKARAGISSIEDELSELLRQKSDATDVAFQAVDAAQKNLSELQAREITLLTTYRPDSPVVLQLHKSILQAQKELAARQADLRTTKSKSHKSAASGGDDTPATGMLGAQVSNINRRIADLESQRNHYNDLARQVQIDEENYKNFKLRAEDARVNEKLNENKITRISIVDEPVAPIRPSRPRKKLIMACCLLAGMLVGSGLIIILESMDERFTRPEQVTELLRVPVVASFGTRPQL